MLRTAVSTCARPVRRRCASAYCAGPGLPDALAACRLLAAHGLRSTVGYSAATGEPAGAVLETHTAAFEALACEELDCYVSVKLPAVGLDPPPFAELVAAAARSGRRLHADAVAPEAVDAIWQLLASSVGAAPLGTTLPGRWRRSPDDAGRAAGLGLAVRVVKGQWPDEGGDREDPAKGFLRVIDRLARHPAVVAVATHDVRLLEEALRRLRAAGTSCEVELFYGLPFRGPALAAQRLRVPVRVYVPYGRAGAPYRRDVLASRPSSALWIAQDLLYGEDKTWRSISRTSARP